MIYCSFAARRRRLALLLTSINNQRISLRSMARMYRVLSKKKPPFVHRRIIAIVNIFICRVYRLTHRFRITMRTLTQ